MGIYRYIYMHTRGFGRSFFTRSARPDSYLRVASQADAEWGERARGERRSIERGAKIDEEKGVYSGENGCPRERGAFAKDREGRGGER